MLNNRGLQGFLAIAPIALLLLIFIAYFAAIFSLFSSIDVIEETNQPPVKFLTGLGVVFLLLFVMVILSLFSFIYFIIHVVKNPNLEQNNMRLIWILIIVLVGGIGNLIYWIVEIESKKPRPLIT